MENTPNTFFNINLDNITEQVETLIYGATEVIKEDPNLPKYYPFKLPIEYLADSDKHLLSPIVEADLELVESQDKESGNNDSKKSESGNNDSKKSESGNNDSKKSESGNCMYHYLFKPTHEFGKHMMPRWKKHFTSNADFLSDSQQVVHNMNEYSKQCNTNQVKCDQLKKIWKDTRQDSHFLEKYSFMDWKMLKYLNESASFLQAVSIVNISSPLMSLFIPIVFMIFPFIILKLQQIPITFSTYIDTLKTVARNHFIGRTLASLEGISWEKMIYLFFTIGLYLMQIYQNINSCYRFYRNMTKISEQLYQLKEYTQYSIKSMETFASLNQHPSYTPFLEDLKSRILHLKKLAELLNAVSPPTPHLRIWEAGYMLRCYYELHSNQDLADSIQYSFGFEGYINNLLGIKANLANGAISAATYMTDKDTEIVAQYYPPYVNKPADEIVVNDCSFNHNIIITGPNAAGKTTMLKTSTINIIFSQQTGFGFYRECRLNPYTHIHSYLNIPDTSGRDSLFQAESRRCKEILDIIQETTTNPQQTSRHYCIFDELYSGTNPEEATKSAYSFLLYLSKFDNVDFVLTTHYFEVCKRFTLLHNKKAHSGSPVTASKGDVLNVQRCKKSKTVENYKMEVVVQDSGKIMYTYKLKPGISDVHGAVKILEDMQYPDEILKSIYQMSDTKNRAKRSCAKDRKKKDAPILLSP